MKLIKVNGFRIAPDKIACMERRTIERHIGSQHEVVNGIAITFDAGGFKWIEGVEADQIEAAIEDWDRDQPLPF